MTAYDFPFFDCTNTSLICTGWYTHYSSWYRQSQSWHRMSLWHGPNSLSKLIQTNFRMLLWCQILKSRRNTTFWSKVGKTGVGEHWTGTHSCCIGKIILGGIYVKFPPIQYIRTKVTKMFLSVKQAQSKEAWNPQKPTKQDQNNTTILYTILPTMPCVCYLRAQRGCLGHGRLWNKQYWVCSACCCVWRVGCVVGGCNVVAAEHGRHG